MFFNSPKMHLLILKSLIILALATGQIVDARASTLDSLQVEASKQTGIEPSKTLLAIGRYYGRQEGRLDSAKYFIQLSIRMAEEDSDYKVSSKATMSLANIYLKHNMNDSLDSALIRAVVAAHLSKDSLLLFRTYSNIAKVKGLQQQSSQSNKNFKEAIKYIDHHAEPDKYAETLAHLAHSYTLMGVYDSARYVYESLFNSIDVSEDVTPETACPIHLGMGSLYSLLGMIDEAKSSASAARTSGERSSNNFCKIKALALSASVHSRANELTLSEVYGLGAFRLADSLDRTRVMGVIANNLGNLYIKLRRYDAAEEYLTLAISIAVQNEHTHSLAVRYCTLTELYIDSDQLEKAAVAAERASKYAAAISDPQVLVELYDNLARIDSIRGNFRSAFKNLRLHHLNRDSLFALEKLEAIAELETKYSLSTKENEIALLTRDQDLQQAANAQMRQRLILLAGGAVGLLLFAGVLINRNRVKERALATIRDQNAVIAAKSRENELLVREVHHRVKNNMAIVQGLLRAQRDNSRDNPELVEALKVCEGQLRSMALIHQDLYDAENLTVVAAPDYFAKVLRHIRGAYPERCGRVAFAVDLAAVDLPIAAAVPLGLILTELVTNAVKYAFPGGEPPEGARPEIDVRLTAADQLTLSVHDNGRGLPDEVAAGGRPGFGLRMVEGLARQMGGAIRLTDSPGGGTRAEVAVPFDREAAANPRDSSDDAGTLSKASPPQAPVASA